MLDLTVDSDDVSLRDKKLIARVEHLLGGRVIAIDRQLRWRPAWFLEVELPNGDIAKVHARGDRESDVLPFPELQREADILQVLESQGIPVPHVYGMCTDPMAIIMETVPGTRDVSTAANDAERQSVARQYIEALVKMHQAPLEPYVEKGIEFPEGAEAIALAGLNAYLPLYEKHKKQADPFIEFALKWLRSNVPMHRTKPGFIAFDAGQFLFEKGEITALYDFEFSMIGDPLTDLATMAMRQSVEPMGDEIGALCHYYAELTGEPLDKAVIRYHHALFATVACMQFVGSTTNPQPGDPHDVYVEWDLALRRSLLFVLAENLGVAVTTPVFASVTSTKKAALMTMLDDSLEQIEVAEGLQQQRKAATARLLEYLTRLEQVEESLDALGTEDAVAILGDAYQQDLDRDEQMEQFVMTAGPEHNETLFYYFAQQIERKVQAYKDISIGQSAAHVRLEPID